MWHYYLQDVILASLVDSKFLFPAKIAAFTISHLATQVHPCDPNLLRSLIPQCNK